MAEGFLALVKEGVIHRYLICLFRDLKPENILIKGTTLKDAKIKIADFGYAKKCFNDTVQLHSFVGTPLYMSP